jgi:cardiolipin synthase C
MRALLLLFLLLAAPAGCGFGDPVSRPKATDFPRTASYAIPQTEDTALGRALAPGVRAHPGESGYRLLSDGAESLKMRLALIRTAERTLDLQYYAVKDDITANLLLEAILRAAARGVRVRFLLDNFNLWDVERALSVLDGNANIEIRAFNPAVTRRAGPFRIFSFLRLSPKRMHNKVLVSDNQMAITGGRNLGDEYFDADANANFTDLDVLAAGPVTAAISGSFDRFWNSDASFPIRALHKPSEDAREIAATRAAIRKSWEEAMATAEGRELLDFGLAARILDGKLALTWARGEVAVDAPRKIDQPQGKAASAPLESIVELASAGTTEFLMVSPYFVPQKEGSEWLAELVRKGMRVRVLTNSLASNDVVAVHAGYRRYRKGLLQSGVELYELKPVGGKRPRQRLFGSRAVRTNLHSKVYVIDRRDVVTGSFNFDPRSFDLNTEICLVIHSTEIAAQVVKMFDESISPKTSYRLALDKKGRVVWLAEEKGHAVRYRRDPKAGLRPLQVFFVSLLPVEGQL